MADRYDILFEYPYNRPLQAGPYILQSGDKVMTRLDHEKVHPPNTGSPQHDPQPLCLWIEEHISLTTT